MRFSSYLAPAFALLSVTNALSLPEEAQALALREAEALSDFIEEHTPSLGSALEKRKGGGGKGGGGGGSKSGGGSSSSSSSRTSTSSNVGGQTKSGSGTKPSYGGGKYYAGGGTVPFKSGSNTPSGIKATTLLPVAALGFFGGAWAYGAWMYPYPHSYNYRNRTRNSTNTRRDETNGILILRQDDTNSTDGTNTTLPVNCLCLDYQVCGCDDTNSTSFLDSLLGNGTTDGLDPTVVRIVDYNGSTAIFLNGTLDNGTTASGGVDDAAGALRAPYQLGMWTLAGAVGCAVMML